MPRGLGDDPLSKRKAKRTAQVLVSGPSQAEAPVAQPSSSYNDVFFQRRSEEVPVQAPVAPVQEEPVSHVEVAAPSVVTPEAAAVTVSAPEPVAVAPAPAVVDSAPAASPIPEPIAQVTAQEAPPPAPTQWAPVEAEQPQAQKTGFFGRIFGKLKK